nr:DUF6644 family protein [Phyllobacterium sp. 21LDTY02-6]
MIWPVLEWLGQTPPALALARNSTLYMLVNAAHILSISVLFGAILPLDLRLAGLFRQLPLTHVGPFLAGFAAVGAACAILTGFMLFSVRPVVYAQNPAFLAKLCILAIGTVNAVALHAGKGWRAAIEDGEISTMVRTGALISLVAWPSAVVAGRWIGFL